MGKKTNDINHSGRNNIVNYLLIESPLGTLLLLSDGKNLKQLSFITDIDDFKAQPGWKRSNDAVLDAVHDQLTEWFSGKRQVFDLPLSPDGTEFQKTAWSQLQKIPYGTTCTYGEQAKAINKPTAVRAIGAANGQNPIALIIPCHRVVGADGSMTGYAFGTNIKQKLLAFEAKHLARATSPESTP